MKRRRFISLLGITAAATLGGARPARTQLPTNAVIGFLCSASERDWALFVAAFHQGLAEHDYAEGRNLIVDYRWADNQLGRLPAMAAELVGKRVAVIVAGGGAAPALAAKAATATIPIVFAYGADPVKSGMVASLNKPGGNATGVTFLATALVPKRLELLRELVPGVTRVGILFNPDNSDAEAIMRDINDATGKLGLTPLLVAARNESDFDDSFGTLVRQGAQAILIAGDRLFIAGRIQLAVLAASHAIPTLHDDRLYPAAGGLISYGPSISDAYRQAGIYTGRILKGEKAADLPVMQPTKFDLIINLKTAKTLRLEVPTKLLALADEVIE
jgi:putative ABC transport system substrate-binding protein